MDASLLRMVRERASEQSPAGGQQGGAGGGGAEHEAPGAVGIDGGAVAPIIDTGMIGTSYDQFKFGFEHICVTPMREGRHDLTAWDSTKPSPKQPHATKGYAKGQMLALMVLNRSVFLHPSLRGLDGGADSLHRTELQADHQRCICFLGRCQHDFGYNGGQPEGREQKNKKKVGKREKKRAPFKGRCYICNEEGHMGAKFPNKKKDATPTAAANVAEGDENGVVLTVACSVAKLLADNKDLWFFDSECSKHMTSRKEWFTVIRDSPATKSVKGFDGSMQEVAGLKANFVSSSGQLMDKGENLQTQEDVTRIIASGGQVAATARYCHRLLCKELKPWPASNSTTAVVACNGTVAQAACNGTAASAACNGMVAVAACNGTAAAVACNGTAAGAACNSTLAAAACNAATAAVACNGTAIGAACNGTTSAVACDGTVAASACDGIAAAATCNGMVAAAACNGTRAAVTSNCMVAAPACNDTVAATACNGTAAGATCNSMAAGAACNGTVAAVTYNGMTKAVAEVASSESEENDEAVSLTTYAVGTKTMLNQRHTHLENDHFGAVRWTATNGGILGMDLEKGAPTASDADDGNNMNDMAFLAKCVYDTDIYYDMEYLDEADEGSIIINLGVPLIGPEGKEVDKGLLVVGYLSSTECYIGQQIVRDRPNKILLLHQNAYVSEVQQQFFKGATLKKQPITPLSSTSFVMQDAELFAKRTMTDRLAAV
ncbi:unnamed protein product [Closterium sp. Yama58-4]|nr:unnamed protein product [Closterium sp. Yama58-4]